ncbi:MAG: hypothetical protein HC911_05750 [Chloroflexaceae bacterium]|nr:hypothetical protein [Chloroflexaceae bacterium]
MQRHTAQVGWFLVVIGLIGSIGVGASAVQLAHAQVTQPFTLEPGGTATIQIEAFCIEFGQFFPAAIRPPNGVAPDNVRAALAHIQQNALTANEADALEAQYALWELLNSPNSPPATSSIAQGVLANATTAPATPGGTSVMEAAQQGTVRMQITAWDPVGDKVRILSATDHFFGRGTLEIENTSDQMLDLYLPIGAAFPAQEMRFQTVSGYPTSIVVNNPNLPGTNTDTPLPVIGLLVVTALSLLGMGYLLRRVAG